MDTNEPYAWGKMGPGRWFHRIAADIDRAWALCRLTGYERIILQYVREKTWGVRQPKDAEPEPCEINLAALATAIGVNRPRLSEALASLVADRLVACADNRFSILKDVSVWAPGRISPEAIAYASGKVDIEARRDRDYSHSSSVRKSGRSQRPEKRTLAGDYRPEKRTIDDGNPDANDRKSGRYSEAAYRNAGASEDLEIKKTINQEAAGGSSASIKDPIPAEPLLPSPDPSPPSPAGSPIDEDRRLARWVFEKVLAATGDRPEAIDFGKAVGYWLSVRIPHHVVAAHVLNFLAFKSKQVEPANHLAYVRSIFENRKPGEATPHVPPEWKPRVACAIDDSILTPEYMANLREARHQNIKRAAEARRQALASMGVAS